MGCAFILNKYLRPLTFDGERFVMSQKPRSGVVECTRSGWSKEIS